MKAVNGTFQHFVMGLMTVPVSILIFGHAWESVVLMLAVEAVQADAFRMGWRWFLEFDTWHDIGMDATGGVCGYAFYVGLRMIYL